MPPSSGCKVDAVLKTIGDRWSLGILHVLSAGPRRTLELHRSFAGLSTKTLAARLKKMERHGIIVRVSYRESPPRVEYSLTEMGLELLPVIDAVAAAWSVFAFDDKGSSSCAACSDIGRAASDRRVEINRDQQSQQDQGVPVTSSRKKTDVTLL